ncbi:hypothetical protein [Candidatus Magnetominusculus dajiuhuensis]|uniref:hypothetical protein n=1 Tax=Candidatus Magnetominusculus dajiuhuensis TaxID=3137712 RepID=UPI003B42D085
MLTKKAAKTLIILTIVLFAFSFAEGGDDLFCVSLKELPKSNKIFHRVVGLDFHSSNAEIYSVLHNPPGFIFEVDKYINGRGSYRGFKWNGPGGFYLEFFYDDFVVIKTRPGVNLDKVKVKFSFTVELYSSDDKGDEIYDGEKTFHIKSKDINIRKCEGMAY